MDDHNEQFAMLVWTIVDKLIAHTQEQTGKLRFK